MGAANKVVLQAVLGNSTQCQPELNLLARHDIYFDTRLADRPAMMEAAYALRYQVYCLERKFENPNEHSTGLETDQYDAHAIQGVLFTAPPIGRLALSE